jgi:hypothetical protein
MTGCDNSLIGNGLQNSLSNTDTSVILNGRYNTINSSTSCILNGSTNILGLNNDDSVIINGQNLTISFGTARNITLLSGLGATIDSNSPNQTIIGGYNNKLYNITNYTVIINGKDNEIYSNSISPVAIVTGKCNYIYSNGRSFIGSGRCNSINGLSLTDCSIGSGSVQIV